MLPHSAWMLPISWLAGTVTASGTQTSSDVAREGRTCTCMLGNTHRSICSDKYNHRCRVFMEKHIIGLRGQTF